MLAAGGGGGTAAAAAAAAASWAGTHKTKPCTPSVGSPCRQRVRHDSPCGCCRSRRAGARKTAASVRS
ncbi:hypothetical protein PF008_g16838 [Phytophthora fragariae]|uniref:Uncharacterized protein n=1 Tax=Phytophthora fragariae TaxID=53985 RepID=A0A6G0RAF8_9STRA|nr:hypothetical protein PF008_g16838 [Phytophthora fragariae]